MVSSMTTPTANAGTQERELRIRITRPREGSEAIYRPILAREERYVSDSKRVVASGHWTFPNWEQAELGRNRLAMGKAVASGQVRSGNPMVRARRQWSSCGPGQAAAQLHCVRSVGGTRGYSKQGDAGRPRDSTRYFDRLKYPAKPMMPAPSS